jgi:hypothetical protein
VRSILKSKQVPPTNKRKAHLCAAKLRILLAQPSHPFFVLQSKTTTKNDIFVWYAFLLLVLVYAQPLSYAQPKDAYW